MITKELMQKVILRIVRFMGVAFGLILVVMAYMNILGFNEPSYGEMPSLYERIKSSMFLLVYGLVLTIPHRLIKGLIWYVLFIVQVVACIFCITMTYSGLIDYSNGLAHIAIVPTSLIILFIVLSNTYLHFKLKKS